jgi:class 3 adenylate cyclase
MSWNVGVGHAGAALYEIGEIRLCQGNLRVAKDAFQQARQSGYDPEPGWSRLQLAEGNIEAATASITRALSDESLGALDRARLLPARVEVAVAGGDLENARSATEDLEKIAQTYGTTALNASAECARGALELARGDAAAASRSLRRGSQLWQNVDNPYEAARARVLLATACRAEGDEDTAVFELQTAISAFDRLGAVPDTRRAENLLGVRTPARAHVAGAIRTFMFTDIVKSSNLIEVIGDEAWEDLMRWHDHTLRSLVETHGGQEINRTGDGFFVAFHGAPAAVECAIAIQRALAEHRRVQGFAPQIRIGLHTAKATHEGRDYKGRGVHVAARIAALAEGESILASVESLDDQPSIPMSARRTVSLRGIADPVEIVRIEWR